MPPPATRGSGSRMATTTRRSPRPSALHCRGRTAVVAAGSRVTMAVPPWPVPCLTQGMDFLVVCRLGGESLADQGAEARSERVGACASGPAGGQLQGPLHPGPPGAAAHPASRRSAGCAITHDKGRNGQLDEHPGKLEAEGLVWFRSARRGLRPSRPRHHGHRWPASGWRSMSSSSQALPGVHDQRGGVIEAHAAGISHDPRVGRPGARAVGDALPAW